ncbi:hypothetical protein KGF54_003685 [Candida jiufengensis]|uniref:uncharacterized protein n=1 Tax=Candida jiufengensis TaxID=497108 RepID=UPI002223F74E|nr:uncharacterized protein KGF54_003685 [Candida jiufengensis]KAI5952818.1 hypothetical protein KGF54_003685 [Candida jiufengensis]
MNCDLLGQKVAVPGAAGQGYIKYLGPIQNKTGLFVGLELIGTVAKTRGKNSGSVEGIQYFQVNVPKSGLFLPYERVKSCNIKLPELNLQNYETKLHTNTNVITPIRSHFNPISENRSPTKHPHPHQHQHQHQHQQHQQQNTTPIRSPLSPINTYQNAKLNLLNNQLIKSENNKDYELIVKDLNSKLKDKDRKLENFGKQREEWHMAMDDLIAVQQEGIQVFEEKILELEGINEEQEKEIISLNLQIDKLVKEKNTIQNKTDKSEVEELQKQLQQANEELKTFKNQSSEIDELKKIIKQSEDRILQLETQNVTKNIESVELNPPSTSSNLLQLNSQEDTIQNLPIYKSDNLTDPSSGKSDWCGLCERDGHSSINCPFENDIF